MCLPHRAVFIWSILQLGYTPVCSSDFAGPYAFGYLCAETRSFVPGFLVLRFCALAAGIIGFRRAVPICNIELTLGGQIQVRFNSLDNLLRRSAQLDR